MASPPPRTLLPQTLSLAQVCVAVAVLSALVICLVGFLLRCLLAPATPVANGQTDAAADMRSDGGPVDGAVDMRSDGGPHDGGRPQCEAVKTALDDLTQAINQDRELIAKLRQQCSPPQSPPTPPRLGVAPAGQLAPLAPQAERFAPFREIREAYALAQSQNEKCIAWQRDYVDVVSILISQLKSQKKEEDKKKDAAVKSDRKDVFTVMNDRLNLFGDTIRGNLSVAFDEKGQEINNGDGKTAMHKLENIKEGKEAILIKKMIGSLDGAIENIRSKNDQMKKETPLSPVPPTLAVLDSKIAALSTLLKSCNGTSAEQIPPCCAVLGQTQAASYQKADDALRLLGQGLCGSGATPAQEGALRRP